MVALKSLQAVFTSFGKPADVLRVEEVSLPPLGADEVLIRMRCASVNPADVNTLEGTYGVKPELPAVPGNEGAGEIAAVGSNVSDWSIGDAVRPPEGVGCWRQYVIAKASCCMPFPSGVPWESLAQLYVNPPTAWRMLHDFASLLPGETVLQNAANSAVGRCVIQICKAKGWRTINLVRRPELVDELKALGADEVLVDGPELKLQLKAAIGKSKVRLALNAVGGDSASTLAKNLGPSGVLVTYGAMSKQPLTLPNGLLIFNDLQARGFWMTRWYRTATRDEKAAMWAELCSLMVEGRLTLPVEKIYPLNEVQSALAHAQRESRSGKILLKLD